MKSKRIVNNVLKPALAVFLLTVYLGTNTQIGFLHQLIHPEEIALDHNDAQEKNACHRSLYHGKDAGCKHEYHLEKRSTCSFTHTLVHSDEIFFSSDRPLFISFVTAKAAIDQNNLLSADDINVLSRGPPSPYFTLVM